MPSPLAVQLELSTELSTSSSRRAATSTRRVAMSSTSTSSSRACSVSVMPYHRRRVSPCARWEIRDEWTRMDVYGLVARLVSPKHTLGDTDCTDLRTRRACRALDATGAPACVLDRSTSLHACAADRRAWEHRLWAMLGLPARADTPNACAASGVCAAPPHTPPWPARHDERTPTAAPVGRRRDG